ncbi:hypothetical protein E3T55_06430 [Cryobacterium frigoriphilum]|uniref:Uncharacterized protein n=1 Tax=Cryobacterium frigoriphilum TaxID=1259150 RepID=A0A4V3IRJ1_9MICO|nr:hypothetical protein [Cryobacterium frigoriphilum]TFD52239.1 hypothetical protein E3T55_06430 [Cryobacterium frigoriphilum]
MRSQRLTWAVIIGAAALTLTLFAAAGWWTARTLFDAQVNLTLVDVMAAEYDAPDSTTNPRDITDEACGAQIPCIEAYDTTEAIYYRFGSRDAATAFAQDLDDGFRSNYIVMDFDGKADGTSTEQQLWAMQGLAGMWQDYEGGFPQR